MQQFPTAAPITVVLDLPAGHVRLIAADRADTTVEVRPADPAKGRDTRAAERVGVALDDGVLRIQAPGAEGLLAGHPGSVEVTVRLPSGSAVDARAAAVELRGVGRLGEVSFDSARGPVKLDEAAGARLALKDGDITVGRLTGPADISTAKGDIRVDQASRGLLELRTGSGDITVTAAPGVSASLDAGTSYGRIDNALRNDGTAGLDIRATTSYGDITARGL
ncbi:DUF4097 family beta strand repeat-containing protein [Nocardiopsis flavescens]|uniref:DUF4097 family beta strand repeat-containing protein n=1 Tax=Nocardiopsis flavescens TaxID=758803 RepID=UPI00366634B6